MKELKANIRQRSDDIEKRLVAQSEDAGGSEPGLRPLSRPGSVKSKRPETGGSSRGGRKSKAKRGGKAADDDAGMGGVVVGENGVGDFIMPEPMGILDANGLPTGYPWAPGSLPPSSIETSEGAMGGAGGFAMGSGPGSEGMPTPTNAAAEVGANLEDSAAFTNDDSEMRGSGEAGLDVDAQREASLYCQSIQIAIVPHKTVKTSKYEGKVHKVWGVINIQDDTPNSFLVTATTSEGTKYVLNCSKSLSLTEACDVAQYRRLPPLEQDEKIELAAELVQLCHVRSDPDRVDDMDQHELRIEIQTPMLSKLAVYQNDDNDWSKRAPRHTYRTSNIIQSVNRFLSKSDSFVFDSHAQLLGATAAEGGEKGVAAKEDGDIITTKTQKVPVLYVSEQDDNDPSETFMSIIAKMGNEDSAPDELDEHAEVTLMAKTLQAIPNVHKSEAQYRVAIRLPMFATVDDEAMNRFVEEILNCLKVVVDEDRNMCPQVSSNRSITPMTGTRPK